MNTTCKEKAMFTYLNCVQLLYMKTIVTIYTKSCNYCIPLSNKLTGPNLTLVQ